MFTLAVLLALSTTTSGPSFAIHGVLAVIFIVGGACIALTGVGAFITKLVIPAFKACIEFFRELRGMISTVNDLGEVKEPILRLAYDFKPNSGGSLHDKIVRIDTNVAANNDEVKELKAGQKELRAEQSQTAEKLHELWDYSHESKHDIVNALTQVAPSLDLIQEMAKRIAIKPQEMDD